MPVIDIIEEYAVDRLGWSAAPHRDLWRMYSPREITQTELDELKELEYAADRYQSLLRDISERPELIFADDEE